MLKFPDYAYFFPSGRAQNGWIWSHGHEISHLKEKKANGKARRCCVCKICMYQKVLFNARKAYILSGNKKKSPCNHDFDDGTTLHMISYMTEHSFSREGQPVLKKENSLFQPKRISSATATNRLVARPFPTHDLQSLCLEYVIGDNLSLRQSIKPRLRKIFTFLNSMSHNILLSSHNPTCA